MVNFLMEFVAAYVLGSLALVVLCSPIIMIVLMIRASREKENSVEERLRKLGY